MAQENLDVRVRLIDARVAQLEAQKTSKAISGIGSSAKKADAETKTGLFSGLSTGVKSLIGMAGVTGLAFGLKDVTQAGLGLQASQTKVQNALRSAGITGTNAFKSIQDQMEKLSTEGGGSVEQMDSGIAQFVGQTNSATEAQKANQAAVQLSIKTGLNYSQTESMIAGVLAGRTRGLQKYVGIIQPVKTAEDQLTESHKLNLNTLEQQAAQMGKNGKSWLLNQERIAGITPEMMQNAAQTDKLASAQNGLNIVLAKTKNAHESTAQKIQDMRHSFQNLEANIGTLLIPVLNRLVTIGDSVSRFLTEHKSLAIALGGALGALGTIAIGRKLVGGIKSAIGAVKGMGKAFDLIEANPWVLAITAGIVILVLLITHFKEVKRIASDVGKAIGTAFTDAFHAVKNVFSDVFSFIRNHWALILSILTGPVGAAVIFIATHFRQVKTIVTDVVHFIEGLATSVFNAITYPFRKAFQFIKDGFNTVKHFIKSIPIIGGLFSHGGPVGHLSHGGPIYRAMGGPSGTDNVPAWLTEGEYVLDQATTSRVGVPALQQLQSGGGLGAENIHITIEPAPVMMDSRVVAQLVLRAAQNRAARGNSSLVGGALATNGGYTALSTGAAT
jgi:hypothetical protein